MERLGAQAEELLEIVESAWGPERASEARKEADRVARAFADPREMTRNYHVYLAAGVPLPRYALQEFAWFVKSGTEKAAGRKMTPEVRQWLLDALARLDGLPPAPG